MINLRKLVLGAVVVVTTSAFAPSKDVFSAAEQQQVSIETPGLFDRSNAFNVDFSIFNNDEYAFPLPVGKASVMKNGIVRITTKKGDNVKAMFGGVVRLSRKTPSQGNVVVIRHNNGLETVYANNTENLVKVGQHVSAGQTIAIVGTKDGETYCEFAIMVNGGRINPNTIFEIKSHNLRRQTVLFKKADDHIDVSVVGKASENKKGSKKNTIASLDPEDADDPFLHSSTFELDLEGLEQEHWAYPLPGAHVISPYGGRRDHGGVDLKTKPNDNIVAAFDGEVTLSGPHYGYGNCITIKHAFGFETLYSHQSRNLVKKGDKVKAGQVIGLTGRTGRATTEHLHFEVYFKGHRLNPNLLFDHTEHQLQRVTLTLKNGGGVTSTKHREQ